MKDKCKIVQDLMPLCIDGAASEESRAWVSGHVSECPACAEVYGQMKAELPRIAAQKEKEEFEAAARQMKRRRRTRIVRLVLAGLVLGCVLIFGGQWLYAELTLYTHCLMDKDEFTVQLYKMSDGTGLIVYDMAQNDAICGQGGGYGSSGIAQLQMYEPVIQLGNERYEKLYGGYRTYKTGYWTEQGWVFDTNVYKESITPDDPEDATGIVKELEYAQQVWVDYGDGQELIYTYGDEVPVCSPEMEAYLQCLETPIIVGKEYDYDKLAQLREAVPEWQ